MADNSNSSESIGFCCLLTVLFIGLKLAHYIDWSWTWVLSPIWLPLSVMLFIAVIAVIIYIIKNR